MQNFQWWLAAMAVMLMALLGSLLPLKHKDATMSHDLPRVPRLSGIHRSDSPYAELPARRHALLSWEKLQWLASSGSTPFADTWSEDDQSAQDANALDCLFHLFPPSRRAHQVRQELNTFLNFGTRVGGAMREPVLQYMAREGLGTRRFDGRRGLWLDAPHLSDVGRRLLEQHHRTHARATVAACEEEGWWWCLGYDNFTEMAPSLESGEMQHTRFTNLGFSFRGGSRRQRRDVDAHDAPRVDQVQEHVVLAAHWDSKRLPHGLLGASDSAISVLMLLRFIKTVAAVTDVAEALGEYFGQQQHPHHAGEHGEENIYGRTASFAAAPPEVLDEALRAVLSPAHVVLLHEYYFAKSGGHERESADSMASWLDAIQRLPALSVLLFDGEEAFHEWEGSDNTYGSRHLAHMWQHTPPLPTDSRAASRYSSVDLFVLLDLLGTPGTQFHNLYPQQSGGAYTVLTRLEQRCRSRALTDSLAITSALSALRGDDDAGGPATPRSTNGGVPQLWVEHGSPREMFSLHGVPRVLTPSSEVLMEDYELLAARTYDQRPRKPREQVKNWLTAANDNVFFRTSTSHGPEVRTQGSIVVDDDHKHWMGTGGVLHLIPIPFSPVWHTLRDDADAIHDGTVVDLGMILWDFILSLGG